MKSLQDFKVKKISNSNEIIGGGFVHTGGFIYINDSVERDVFYDTNGDGLCNTASEWESHVSVTVSKSVR